MMNTGYKIIMIGTYFLILFVGKKIVFTAFFLRKYFLGHIWQRSNAHTTFFLEHEPEASLAALGCEKRFIFLRIIIRIERKQIKA